MSGIFTGETVAVLASGPSLTDEDIEAVRLSGIKTIAVNSTWAKARFCNLIFAADFKWWQSEEGGQLVDIDVPRASFSINAEKSHDAPRFPSKIAKKGGYNSGCIAIEYALVEGAEKVILLGFDCSVKNGIHHHGKHKTMGNPTDNKCYIWKDQFKRLHKLYRDAEVINCSRYTELTMFPRMDLESALESMAKPSVHAA